MKGRVHYVSPKGSAEAVAEAIARECKIVKEPLMPAYMPEGIVLMFLGCEGTKMDKVTKEFISSMDKKRVENVALFGCNPKMSQAALDEMRSELTARGVNVLKQTFVCGGKGGLFSGGHAPNETDLENARKFAADCIKQVMGE